MTKISINQIKRMFEGGAKVISDNYEYINELNVFPVPDGDTGSNMKITAEGAISTIKDAHFNDLYSLGRQFSRALLMNARGNSGVIFSQIIKGFVSVFKENCNELTIGELISGYAKASEIAYRAVTNPVEGTILTVIRVISENIEKKRNTYKSIEDLLVDVIKEGEDILVKTPDFLPELKEAGVVDSGGYGLICFFKGMHEALLASDPKTVAIKTNVPKQQSKKPIKQANIAFSNDNNDGFGYCCEFILKLGSKVVLDQKDKRSFDESELKEQFLKFGESLAIVRDEEILKVHVHTVNPYKVLQLGQQYGEFSKVKIENMTFQFLERNPGVSLEKSSKSNTNLSSKPAIIVTTPTKQLTKLFKEELAVNYVIDCECNGNPSIQEFVTALNAVHSNKVILLVDDGNMILAAKEAIQLFKNINKKATIHLINTGDIAATHELCLIYNNENDFDSNFKNIIKHQKRIAVGKISRSIKMIKYSHINVKMNDYIGIISKKIISSSKSISTTIKQTLGMLIKANKNAKDAYVFYGKDAKSETFNVIEKELNEKYGVKIHLIPSEETVYLFHFLLS